jgi:RimJ/RimL family protein N-acetyltransferase
MHRNDLKLIGKKVYLRPIKESDVTEDYLSWLKDPEVMLGIESSGYTLENLKEYVFSKITSEKDYFFVICDQQNDKHIGNIKLEITDSKAQVAELGLLIGDKSYWGKGIGSEICRLVINFGFNQIYLRKIFLAVYENNPNAKKLYEKLGFKLEGILRKHIIVQSVYYDKYLMGLFKEEQL